MFISIKNIGKLAFASIEIDGITIIAGENNTGKSTVGKALYSTFNSFFHVKDLINMERLDSLNRIVSRMLSNITYSQRGTFPNVSKVSKAIIGDWTKDLDDFEKLKVKIINVLQQFGEKYELQIDIDEETIDKSILHIQDILKISDEDIFKFAINQKITGEFEGQINNIFSESTASIELGINGVNIFVKIKDNSVVSVQNKIDLRTEAVYIDDPNIFDESPRFIRHRNMRYTDHQKNLKAKFWYGNENENLIDEIIVTNKLAKIYKKISNVCNGEITGNSRSEFGYCEAGSDKVLKMQNLSMGLKIFIILKTLLERGMIEQDGVVILDEPEIHLHPEWQVLLAELIVMLQKDFSLHVLLTTHSPYFLRAIQVYAGKYEVADKCRYYLSEEKNGLAYINNVTGEEEKIYEKLAKVFQELEDERWKDNKSF